MHLSRFDTMFRQVLGSEYKQTTQFVTIGILQVAFIRGGRKSSKCSTNSASTVVMIIQLCALVMHITSYWYCHIFHRRCRGNRPSRHNTWQTVSDRLTGPPPLEVAFGTLYLTTTREVPTSSDSWERSISSNSKLQARALHVVQKTTARQG